MIRVDHLSVNIALAVDDISRKRKKDSRRKEIIVSIFGILFVSFD